MGQKGRMGQRVKTPGRPRKFWDASALARKAQDYFDKRDSRVKRQVTKEGEIIDVPNPAPYTLEGLCCYLQIVTQTFRNWMREDSPVGQRARIIMQQICDNRVSGALDGVQNAQFARFLLVNQAPEQYREKVEVEHNVADEVRSILDLCTGLKAPVEQGNRE